MSPKRGVGFGTPNGVSGARKFRNSVQIFSPTSISRTFWGADPAERPEDLQLLSKIINLRIWGQIPCENYRLRINTQTSGRDTLRCFCCPILCVNDDGTINVTIGQLKNCGENTPSVPPIDPTECVTTIYSPGAILEAKRGTLSTRCCFGGPKKLFDSFFII